MNDNPDRKNALMSLLEALGKFLPFVPDRWRPAAAAALTFLALLVGALFYTGVPGGGPSAPAFLPVTGITFDQRDLTILKDRKTGQVQSAVAAQDLPIAPLMNWENIDVRLGRVQTWCLQEADAGAQQVFRDTMNQLHARFPSHIKWTEGCPGPYTLGSDAQIQCGIGDGAVACAGPVEWVQPNYTPPANSFTFANGHVSYNGNYRSGASAPGLSDKGMKAALSHEVQHLELNLGHNVCGYSPASVMTPIYLPDGPTCSNPGATGLEPEDWGNAISYYGLEESPPKSPPPPTPSPSPPPPITGRQVRNQQWQSLKQVPAGTSCSTGWTSDGWCVTIVSSGVVPSGGAWYTTVVIEPDGTFSFPDGFLRVEDH